MHASGETTHVAVASHEYRRALPRRRRSLREWWCEGVFHVLPAGTVIVIISPHLSVSPILPSHQAYPYHCTRCARCTSCPPSPHVKEPSRLRDRGEKNRTCPTRKKALKKRITSPTHHFACPHHRSFCNSRLVGFCTLSIISGDCATTDSPLDSPFPYPYQLIAQGLRG